MTAAPALSHAIVLFASSRRHGNTGRLVDRIASELDVEVVDLAGLRINPYDYDHSSRHDDFEPLMQRVLAYPRIVLASPVYWYAVSPPMKAFLDRISDLLEVPELLPQGRRLRGKAAFIACTSICEEPAPAFMSALCETFDYLGMRFGGAVHVNCVEGYQPALHDAEALAFAARLRDFSPLQQSRLAE